MSKTLKILQETNKKIGLGSEKAVIGCLILDPDLMEVCESMGVTTNFLREDIHVAIWNIIAKVRRENLNFDLIYLEENGIEHDAWQPIIDEVGLFANHFDTYLYNMCLALIQDGIHLQMEENPEDLGSIQNQIDNFHAMFSGSDLKDVSEIAAEATESILYPDKVAEITLPWKSLNKMLSGLRRGKLIFIGGRPGHHKSNMAINISNHVLSQGFNVLYCDYEMGELEIFQRHVGTKYGFSHKEMATGSDENGKKTHKTIRKEMADAVEDFRKEFGSHLKIASYPKYPKLRSLIKANEISVVIVDHIQLFAAHHPLKKGETKPSHINDMCARLKRLAMEMNVCIIAPSQIDRNHQGPPKKHHFKESAGIEENGDVLFGVWWPEAEGDTKDSQGHDCNESKFELEIAKNRGGPQGYYHLLVNAKTGKIEER